MVKVMIAVNPETKNKFRSLPFPDYLRTDEARIRFIIDKFSNVVNTTI